MNVNGFTIIHNLRVRLPEPLYPYRGKYSIEVCNTSDLQNDDDAWVGIVQLGNLFPAKFLDRNPLNTPGPIYGGETDTCATGPAEAPLNVLLDDGGHEFVFSQPANAIEFRDLLSAALCECFSGYGADGNSHWRLSLIQEWWKTRGDMLGHIDERFGTASSILRWRQGLGGELEPYLRVYAFFVENGRVPNEDDQLPDL